MFNLIKLIKLKIKLNKIHQEICKTNWFAEVRMNPGAEKRLEGLRSKKSKLLDKICCL